MAAENCSPRHLPQPLPMLPTQPPSPGDSALNQSNKLEGRENERDGRVRSQQGCR